MLRASAAILVTLLAGACERAPAATSGPAFDFATAADRAALRLRRAHPPARYAVGATLEVWRVGGGRYAGKRERVWALVAPPRQPLPETVTLGQAPTGFISTGNPGALRLPGRYEVRVEPDSGTFTPLIFEIGTDGSVAPDAAT